MKTAVFLGTKNAEKPTINGAIAGILHVRFTYNIETRNIAEEHRLGAGNQLSEN